MTSRALREAIDYASHERLKMTLKAICEKSAVARELVGHELMVDSRSSSEEPVFHRPPSSLSAATSFPSVLPMAAVLHANANGGAVPATPPSRKRPSVQFVECVRCNRKFETVADNSSPGDCVWHLGPLNVDLDHDIWTDWCDKTYGPLDNEENMRNNFPQYPEGFVWTCCGGRGDSNGCQRGPHQQREASIKRVRV
ncbi:uncharacterized protein BKCO1_4000203 [Diplodia corticola]|uniref:C2H2-type domain-containing protein n=1 Tax=Diplodia corticola TaxID=236234 RepID=A0A1J9SE36_9PEZI|nr:uncharacterized protein BKCO1_4000203 [Diplodia corticola]OJD38695.1 hypothetical protein BKCO1_4000203 [Diplodia corticola]